MALLLVMAACGDADPAEDLGGELAEPDGLGDPSGDEPPAPPDDEALPEDPQPLGPPEVEVLDAGQQPRAELRLEPTVGDAGALVLTTDRRDDGAETDDVEPGATPQQFPRMTLELEVEDGDGLGFDVAFAVSDTAADVEHLVAVLTTITGTLAVDDRGRLHDLEYGRPGEEPDVPPDGDDPWIAMTLALDALTGMLPVLPEEEVGDGAVWTYERRALSPMPALETVTVTLDGLDGDDYQLRLEIEQSVDEDFFAVQEEQAQERDGHQPHGTPTLDGQGNGVIRGSLGQLLPQTASRSLRAETSAELLDGQRHEATLEIDDRLEGR